MSWLTGCRTIEQSNIVALFSREAGFCMTQKEQQILNIDLSRCLTQKLYQL